MIICYTDTYVECVVNMSICCPIMQLVLLMAVITCGIIDITRMTSLGAELHEDTTNILNRLLNGSDSRLRPLYGGRVTADLLSVLLYCGTALLALSL